MPLVDLNDPVHLGINVRPERYLGGHPNTRPEVRLTYPRLHVLPLLRERWAWLVPLLGLTPTSSIILIGAAYGYSLEVLAEMGLARVIGLETAAGIRAKFAESEDADVQVAIEAVGLSIATGDGLRLYNALRERPGQARSPRATDILNEDLANNSSRNRVRTAILAKGGTTGWEVITENVLTVLSDAECVTLTGRARQITGIARLIHLVSAARIKAGERININPAYNSKTVAEWKALLPLDTIVDVYTREIL